MISFSIDKQRGKVNAEWMSRPVDSIKKSKINQPLASVLISMEQSPTFAYRLKSKLLSGPIIGGAYRRIARVMMNAELSAKGLAKIIIPTVYREDYMGALRKLTRQRVADAYVRMLLRAYEFGSTLVGDSIDDMEKHLIKCDAFKEPKEGKLNIVNW